MASYSVGQAIWLANYVGPTASPTGGYRNTSGVLYDPATVTLKYQLPGGAVQTVTPTKDAVGLYHYVITPTAPGDGQYAFLSSDGAYANSTFQVFPAPI